jgi:hypothetical protein
MKSLAMDPISRSTHIAGLGFAIVLSFSAASGIAQTEKGSTPARTPAATAAPSSPTPDTKIDAKTEAELLQAEDRLINAIRNRDAKELEEILHPRYADAMEGSERAMVKRAVISRALEGRLPAYKIEKERKLVRSGDVFDVQGLANNVAQELTEDSPTEKWAFVRRIWTKEGGRWIATAQMVKELEENEAREKLAPDADKKKPDPQEKKPD